MMGRDKKTLTQRMSDMLLRSRWVSVVPRRGEEEVVDYSKTNLGGPSVLKPESELRSKLFDWPDVAFSEANCVASMFKAEPFKQLTAGDFGVDFTLADGHGTNHRLSNLLREKPVIIASVTLSCPHCSAHASAMANFAESYSQFHCVAVYVPQPHPERPETSFENGKIWEMPYSKGVKQERSLEERRASVLILQKELGSRWLVLADDLRATRVNPFWSTYGPAPRCSYLLDTSGLICHAQLWWEPPRAKKAADAYLKAAANATAGRKQENEEEESKKGSS